MSLSMFSFCFIKLKLSKKRKRQKKTGIKLGIAEGLFNYPEAIHAGDDITADAFEDYL